LILSEDTIRKTLSLSDLRN